MMLLVGAGLMLRTIRALESFEVSSKGGTLPADALEESEDDFEEEDKRPEPDPEPEA